MCRPYIVKTIKFMYGGVQRNRMETALVEPYNVPDARLHFTAPYNVTSYILRRLVTLYGHSINV